VTGRGYSCSIGDKTDAPQPLTRRSIPMEHATFERITVAGLKIRTTNTAEMNPETAAIGKLWQSVGRAIETSGKMPKKVYGIYNNYESDDQGAYDLLAGTEPPFPEASDTSIESVSLPGGTYVRFTRSGPPMETAMAAWQEVWDFFQQPDAPKRSYLYDVEVYSGTDTLDLYIGIKGDD
ncbi:MAG: GyrI-like domain-containing protein, partial [Desulfobacterales bacterium]|nr:GyrI-like domain-containing protein [Desulfobacterales bacterium]